MQLLHSSIFVISFLVLSIILNQTPPSFCDDDHDEYYQNCSTSFNCANLHNLRYPFWGSNRPQYCGHPSFQLDCKGQVALITIMSENYLVLEVIDSSHSLKVARTDYWNNTCPNQLKNTTIGCNNSLFGYGPDSQNLTLYYDCPTPPVSIPYTFSPQFNCSVNGTQMVNYFVVESVMQNARSSYSLSEMMGGCMYRVTVPILDSEAKVIETNSTVENLKTALDSGFGLEWNANNSLCDECQSSGGHCGYSTDSGEFSCYCRDGSFKSSCPSGKSSSSKVPIGIGVAVGVAVLVGISVCVFFVVRRRKKNVERSRSKDLFMAPSSGGPPSSTTTTSQSVSSYPSSVSESLPKSYYYGVQVFNYDELEEATKNFDPSRELGEGGFGTVYKGILQDGRVVAVKRHYESNFKRAEQFMNEVQILAPLRHKNLVTLFGCTSRHSRELLLVYEFIPNGTLADHLHGKSSKSTLLPWPVRFSIALETAEALAYLHLNDVIHRDVKSNNILLTEKFQVKVADFGLSRLFPSFVTHVSTAPQGTPGYVDPEYYQNYQLTDKSDVYSFGVVLVELISSLQAVDITRRRNEVNLASLAVNRIQSQALHELIDPYLGFEKDNGVKRMVTAVAELAFRCLQQQRDMRPSMNEVLEILREIKGDEFSSREAETVVDIKTEEMILLKKVPSPISPDSVADKWVSSSSTSSSY